MSRYQRPPVVASNGDWDVTYSRTAGRDIYQVNALINGRPRLAAQYPTLAQATAHIDRYLARHPAPGCCVLHPRATR